MSVEDFIREMPRVELDIRLEGAIQPDRLLVIAEQNEIEERLKHFDQWVRLLKEPDYTRLHELVRVITSWLQHPDDLAHVVYELGMSLAKQNVRYAEVSVNPVAFIENGFTFETFLNAINDGRERAERAWGIRMAWILSIPRDNPRSADDVARWASNSGARKAGVAGLGLEGEEQSQPIGQFERAFRMAEKKGLQRVFVHSVEKQVEKVMLEALEQLNPDRIADGWGIANSPEVMQVLHERQIPVNVCLARVVRTKQIERYADYPLRQLYDEGLLLTIGTRMPSLYKTSLVQEYQAVVEHCDFSIEELEEIALNAVRASLLPGEEKQVLLEQFSQEYARLKAEHLSGETPQV